MWRKISVIKDHLKSVTKIYLSRETFDVFYHIKIKCMVIIVKTKIKNNLGKMFYKSYTIYKGMNSFIIQKDLTNYIKSQNLLEKVVKRQNKKNIHKKTIRGAKTHRIDELCSQIITHLYAYMHFNQITLGNNLKN